MVVVCPRVALPMMANGHGTSAERGTRVAQHRDLDHQLATENGKGEAWGLTGHSNQPGTQQRRRRDKAALMVPVNSQIGENGRKWKGGGERGRGGGDEVFSSSAKQMVERTRREHHWPGNL